MELSDRSNWLLSGLVGALFVANGAVWLLRSSDALLGLLVGVVMGLGGGLAILNAAVALRDPASADQEWTRRKTRTNVVAVALLSLALVAAILTL